MISSQEQERWKIIHKLLEANCNTISSRHPNRTTQVNTILWEDVIISQKNERNQPIAFSVVLKWNWCLAVLRWADRDGIDTVAPSARETAARVWDVARFELSEVYSDYSSLSLHRCSYSIFTNKLRRRLDERRIWGVNKNKRGNRHQKNSKFEDCYIRH